jgi:hypothetical protein
MHLAQGAGEQSPLKRNGYFQVFPHRELRPTKTELLRAGGT